MNELVNSYILVYSCWHWMFTAAGGEGRALSRRVKFICKRRGGVRTLQRVKRKQSMQAVFIFVYLLLKLKHIHCSVIRIQIVMFGLIHYRPEIIQNSYLLAGKSHVVP